MDRAGIVGEDGATHQGFYDIAYLRTLPNMVVMAPKDENELRRMLKTCIDHPGPAAFRYPRGSGLGVDLDPEIKALEIGKGEIVKEGNDVAIFAYGHMVPPAQEAAQLLENDGISVAVINARFAKPVDKTLVAKYADITKCFVTLEEHSVKGGFGSAILETLQDEEVTPGVQTKCIGLGDIVLEHGSPGAQRKDLQLDPQGIYETVLEHYTRVVNGLTVPGKDKKLLGGNGKKAYLGNVKKSHLKIKQSVNG